MNSGDTTATIGGPGREPQRSGLERAQWRQLALITAVAIVIFYGLRALPTGTNLSHMDFRVDPKGSAAAIEFCDPSNPQFIPVVAMRSPVVMTVIPEGMPLKGSPVRGTVTLQTGSGKPIAAEDLLVTHTRKLHLLIVDESLEDYQHVHPDMGRERGTWEFVFTPQRMGHYRVFADFTPEATGRGLYASADLHIVSLTEPPPTTPIRPGPVDGVWSASVTQGAYQFKLTAAGGAVQAGKPAELTLAVWRGDGAAVPMEPVMDALAHLVAFDETRSGFAHLHPASSDLDPASNQNRPTLRFTLTIPQAGRYVVWAQMNLAGQETFVPFWFEVAT
jgi:hypothetical protein